MLDKISGWLTALPPPLNAPFIVNHLFGWEGSLIAAGIGAVIAAGLLWMRRAR